MLDGQRVEIKKLDDDQSAVAAHLTGQGHALVIAGPGSGKTHTVVERSIRLIEDGVWPRHIMMMTFTNKAAKEMRTRFMRRVAEAGLPPDDIPTITTFHAFGHRLAVKNPAPCGLAASPSLMGEDDQDRLLRECLAKPMPSDRAAREIKTAIAAYEDIRNLGLAAGWPADEANIRKMLGKSLEKLAGKAWDGLCAYQAAKKSTNTLDFHDLLILPIHALEGDRELRERVRRFASDMTVDEAQDTNLAQYRLVKMLVPPGADGGQRTLVLVGDEDQAIHCWRGANPDNLRLFEKDYGPFVYRLQNNYRSLPGIVGHSNQVIAHNAGRHEKTGRPVRLEKEAASPGGMARKAFTPVGLWKHSDGGDMARHIANAVARSLEAGVPPAEIAVLYRTNKMAEALEPALLAAGVPYRVYRGSELMGRAECKMLGAAVRLAVNPCDLQAFERLSALIPGLGQKRLDEALADAGPLASVYDLLRRMAEKRQDGVVHNTLHFLEGIEDLRQKGPRHLLKWADSAMREWLASQASGAVGREGEGKKPEGFAAWRKKAMGRDLSAAEAASLADPDPVRQATLEDECRQWQERTTLAIRESVARLRLVVETIAERLDSLQASDPASDLTDQWQEAAAIAAAPPDSEGKFPKVSLMTCHAAKGLEFQEVHVAGFSDGLMPLKIKGEDGAEVVQDVEEERRLAYVAMTRAKNRLVLHHATELCLSNGKGWVRYQPSRFCREAGIDTGNAWQSEDRPALLRLDPAVSERLRNDALKIERRSGEPRSHLAGDPPASLPFTEPPPQDESQAAEWLSSRW
jgi:superfamily I DNA/RNA helicase